ncbi:MAG: hypothetical protein GX607_00165 [Myxococcales bacterium]|nr:hypothetical protein [Myxococcales bacterium]
MNVTCPACSSRYAIPDEKIAGRRARIKCKRCGQLVSVDGRHLTPPQAPPPPSAPPRAAPAAAHPSAAPATPSRWTLAQPSGAKAQIDTATLVALYREQRVEPGALLWREGMDRWLPPYDIAEIVDALQRAGLTVPGSDLGASFDEDEEATRVALSPLLPSQVQSPAPSSETAAADEDAFGDDEVTRAFEPSPFASPAPSAPHAAAEDVDDDEVTRAFEASSISSPHASDLDEEATRIFESSPRSSGPAGPPPPARLDPSFLGPTTAPPAEEAPRPFEARSILSVPTHDEISDVSGLADSVPALQRTSVSWRPSAPSKRRSRLWWLLVPALLASGVGVVQWRAPHWIDRLEAELLALLGRAPAPSGAETLPPFDTEHVGAVLEEAARAAPRCKLPDGPTGPGRVHVRYSNSGRTEAAEVSEPFQGTEVGECLTALFAATRVPPFSGRPVIVGKNFTVE